MFERDVKTIGKHINNALKEELSEQNSVIAKFATTASDNKTYMVEHYNLDVIISVGYRVKSKRGVEFRRWANSVLKEYILKGYAVNHKRMNQLNEVIRVMKRVENSLDSKQVLAVVERYSQALDLLDAYDHHLPVNLRRFTKNSVNLRQNRKIEESAGKPVIHDNRTANVRLYQGLKAYEGI